MFNPNNQSRAECAQQGLEAYATAKEGSASYDETHDMAADLICDLLHLIEQETGSSESAMKGLLTARTNYEAESMSDDDCRLDSPLREAAPDMLAALKRTRSMIGSLATNYAVWLSEVETAISKAEGK